MESYIFRTRSGTVGFFQRDTNGCYICLNTELFPKIRHFTWPCIRGGRDIGSKGDVSEDVIKHYIQIIDRRVSSGVITQYINIRDQRVSADISEFLKASNAGEYFPRIYRNNIGFTNEASFLDEVRSFYNLYDSLDNLFNYIEPSIQNLEAYGHKSIELLILSCTEVEYLLRQFLKDNNYMIQPRYTTNDYIKCRDIFKLNAYSARLIYYPLLGEFAPFKNWADAKPTASLDWYDAYNSVKHDRGGNFKRATLKHLIESIAAIHILLEAQYGSDIFRPPFKSNYKSIFRTVSVPTWELHELFVPIFENEEDVKWKSCRGYFDGKTPNI